MGFFSRLLLQLELKREASFRDELLILFEITFANSRRKLIFERDSFRDYFCKLKRWLLFEITFANSREGFFSRLLLQTQEVASFREGFFSRLLVQTQKGASFRGCFFSRLTLQTQEEASFRDYFLQTQEESFFSRRLFKITFSLQIQEGTELLFNMGFFRRLSPLGLFLRFCCSSIYFGAKTCLPGLSSVRTCDEIPKDTQNRRNEECI